MITAVHTLNNLPSRTIEGSLSDRVEGRINETSHGKYIQISSGGWVCCDNIKFDDNAEQIAVTIARIIELALNAGFEQGRGYVRNAIGYK